MSDIRAKIVSVMQEVAGSRGQALNGLEDNTVLLDSGLDSLGFAIMVARLEEELGYDPFILMTHSVYPRTLGELIEIYQQFQPR